MAMTLLLPSKGVVDVKTYLYMIVRISGGRGSRMQSHWGGALGFLAVDGMSRSSVELVG